MPKDNVSFIDDNVIIDGNDYAGDVKFYVIPPPPPKAGDVAYWDGSRVRTVPLDEYNTSMGVAVGVVAIPG